MAPLKRTWAPRGQTPRVRTSIQHHPRRNLKQIAGILDIHHHQITGQDIGRRLEYSRDGKGGLGKIRAEHGQKGAALPLHDLLD